MNEKLRRLLDETNDVHRTLPLDEEEMAEGRLLQKPVLASRLLSDMESLDLWSVVTTYSKTKPEPLADPDDLADRLPIIPTPTIALSAERCVCGTHSLKFVHPTNLPAFSVKSPGRIYAQPSAVCRVDKENWGDWNRLSAWIYPVAPGMKSITLRMQLHNDGERKVPDMYERDGAHNMSLKNEQWNHVVLEMPYLDRDCVTGVSFDYDMCGHENDAADQVVWYIDRLELQKVDCDHYEGWIPKEDRICYSHCGYQPGAEKIAIASGIRADSFKLIETAGGKVVLEKKIETVDAEIGRLQILDFSEIMDEGEYLIAAGELTTRTFSISAQVWESSIWKVLNFFLVLRCGYEVPGKHRKCHGDVLLKHGDKSIIADGGWHDAADLAQGLVNTIEGTEALLSLALALKDSGNNRLYKRVLEEAKWGLDYVLKMRFGDGYRSTYSSISIWTDGVIGTPDDIEVEAARLAYTNLNAAYAEALGAAAFAEEDPDYARYALKTAREDFGFGVEIWRETQEKAKSFKPEEMQFSIGDVVDPQACSAGALAAAKLYEITREQDYADHAEFFGGIIMECQQKEITDWDVPMVGFFYQDRKKDLIWHHNHMSYSQLPSLAMRTLCEVFPASPKYIDWYATLALEGEYYRSMAKHTFPFGMIPAGAHHTDEGRDHGMKVYANHPGITWGVDDFAAHMPHAQYENIVRNGFRVAEDYFVRAFPVWFSFRGNYNVMLSETVAINAAAALRNDCGLYNIAQNQYEFIIGKNPFGQSTMTGEGHDYVQLYTVQPGQTAGALSVGMESHFDRDEPYWPQVNTATYKEVWVCSATKWMWGMADSFLPAKATGYIALNGSKAITFENQKTGKVFSVTPHGRTGFYEITLPAGEYTMRYADTARSLRVVSGKTYEIDGALYALTAAAKAEGGKITVTLSSDRGVALPVEVRASNAAGLNGKYVIPAGGSLKLEGTFIHDKIPYVGLVIPDGNLADAAEFIDERLR